MSNDWIEHNGGPQPVADDVWVEVFHSPPTGPKFRMTADNSSLIWENNKLYYRILNDHLIKAARKDGFEAGLEKSAEVANLEGRQNIPRDDQHLIDAALERGIRLGLEAAVAEVWNDSLGNRIDGWRAVKNIRNLNPDTIAKEAQHD